MVRSGPKPVCFEQGDVAAEATFRNRLPAESRRGQGKSPPQREEPPVPRDEAIWLDGRVPNGYWDQPAHRRRYLRWLGQQLGVRHRQDWYQITTDDFKKHAGGGLLHHWSDSAIRAVQDIYRDYDWKEWMFQTAPRRFWHDVRNHRLFMEWLEKRLGIREPSDWYRVTNQDFREHGGGAFLLHYDSTVSAAIMSYLPDYDWKEWMFEKTPKGFWEQRKNRRRYLEWLGEKLGYQSWDDWHAVTTSDFTDNYGNQFLKRCGGSPVAALRDGFPRRTWHEWKFARVPAGFWEDLDNCKRYVRWLAKRLKIRRLQDWQRVRRRDVLENYGGGLLAMYRSHWELLAKCVPGLQSGPAAAGKQPAQRRRRTGGRGAGIAPSPARQPRPTRKPSPK
jgi:hypothetical protein